MIPVHKYKMSQFMLNKIICQLLYYSIAVPWLDSHPIHSYQEGLLRLDNADTSISSFATINRSAFFTPKKYIVLPSNPHTTFPDMCIVSGDTGY